MEKTPLILHGHFYQPPRENPRTDIIDIQESATPFSDWNENIWASCYRANAHSRYLSFTQVESITNNYEYISFNFGPTLLSWMHQTHPETLEEIIQADRQSVQRLGHGNAIAQGFNHTILPLDSKENALLEVEWALDCFRKWFGRESEGFWCPEAGINGDVIDLLSEKGVKFVILSPWQCQAVEGKDGKMQALEGKPAPFDHPYLLKGTTGKPLTAFFYHPDLASGISFGHFLQNADNLYQKLLDIKTKDNPSLIHTATDGEIYGHHEPYGDMALAALIRKVTTRNDFEFLNYGTFLERHPATQTAVLLSGEEGKGTSWSCCHGVSRWYKDCGCKTGGDPSWNQKWRTPLRIAFTNVNEKIREGSKRFLDEIFHGSCDLQEFLRLFGPVPADQTSMMDFLDQVRKEHPFDHAYDSKLAQIAECMLFSLYSFTSCGWFFSDLGGIEPRQNINYALRSIAIFRRIGGEDLLPQFLLDLQDAKCNRVEDGNGMTIAAKEYAKPSGSVEAAVFYHFHDLFGNSDLKKTEYGRFTLLSIKDDVIRFWDHYALVPLHATVREITNPCIIDEEMRLEVYVVNEQNGMVIYDGVITSGDLSRKLITRFNDQMAHRLSAPFDITDCTELAKEVVRSRINKAYTHHSMGVLETELLGLSFLALERMVDIKNGEKWQDYKESFFTLVAFVARSPRDFDRDRLTDMIDRFVMPLVVMKAEQTHMSDFYLDELTEAIHMVRMKGLPVRLTEIQEYFYPYITKDCSVSMRKLGYELNFAATVVHGQG